jgi:hypothetical protein
MRFTGPLKALAVVVAAQVLGIACAALTPTQRIEIANTAAQIEACQEEGRACKTFASGDAGGANCYGVYDACMRDAGLR